MFDITNKKVYIEITQTCNLGCVSCFQRNWTDGFKMMSDEIFDRLNQNLHQLDTLEHIVIGGIGEPTTHPKLIEMVTALPKVKMSITTNGYNWSDEIIDLLVDRFDQIIISVDGLEETFKKIRTFDFSILEANIHRLNQKKQKHNRPVLVAQLVLSKWNLDEVTPLISKLKKLGFNKCIISNLLPQNYFSKDLIVYTLDSNQKMIDYKNEWLNVAMSNQFQLKFPNFELKTVRECVFITDGTTTVCADGNVAPCYRFAHPSTEYVFGRYKKVYPFYYGNVLDQSLQDIYTSPLYHDLRMQNYMNRFPSCPDCDLVHACDYVNDSQCDCNGQYPSCADCLWTRGFVECI